MATTLKRCITGLNQGGWHAAVGQIFDSNHVYVITYPGNFAALPDAVTAYVQTYSTAAATVPAATVAAVATTAATNVTPYGFAGAAQTDAIPVAINALAADVLALKKVITQIIDDMQAIGLAT